MSRPPAQGPRRPPGAKNRAGETPAGRGTVLARQRKAVRRWWEGTEAKRPEALVGLALSGGGIRSATFSLGIVQGLAGAEREALSKIDIVSSVSGGGYIACFLRSLFLPSRARGIAPGLKGNVTSGEVDLDPKEVEDQYRFAMAVLRSGPDVDMLRWEEPGTGKGQAGREVLRRNPLWWLRQHSRYLAPNGPTDYGFAVSYIARNWLAMLYIFLLASLGIFTGVVLAEALAGRFLPLSDWGWVALAPEADRQLPCGLCQPGSELAFPVSPVLWLAAIPLVMSAVHSIAYWMTQAMSPNEPEVRRQRGHLLGAATGTVLAAGVIVLLARWLMPGAFPPEAAAFEFQPGAARFVRLLALGVALMALGAVTAVAFWLFLRRKGPGLTGEIRRQLTQWTTNWNFWLAIVFVVALVDSAGAGLETWFRSPTGFSLGTVIAGGLPFLAYVIKKLPDWFGGNGEQGRIAALLGRFLTTIALVAGIVLFGMLAVAADAIAHGVAWGGMAWSDPQWPRLTLFVLLILVLAVLSGTATGFINLSSLHALYSARLTRAYLGASNNRRLEAAANGGRDGDRPPKAPPKRGSSIKETHPADYIQPPVYFRSDLPAPLHIVNCTLNETIDPNSQLVSRDRKGDILSLEPSGIRIAGVLTDWSRIGGKEAEQLSLGQWCSISGAAASSGMGRLTSLGFALAFTFANVRLGYWWWSPHVCRVDRAAGPTMRAFAERFGTFVYLFNEMTARYSRGYDRKYVTDGGHFENSGAYRLIERRVPFIIVSDNGADPKYRFEDLENLARKVRLDLGGEIALLDEDERLAMLRRLGAIETAIFAEPPSPRWPDWRDQFVSKDSSAFVLLLKATFADEVLDILWIKPRTQPGMPPDLMGYAASNPSFPQQPTGDQFFDEAQWESYRCLGEISMRRLLETCPGLLP